MTKEKLVSIHVHTPFKLTMDDNSVREFGKGRHNVPETVARHWFAQAHSEISDSVVNDADDQQTLIDSLQAQIADKDAFITDLKAALVEMKEQNDSLQAQIAAQGGGNGVKDAKESKPAHGK
jgi:septal ring factor EnvC (AmiA/AmiB activator)